MASPSSPHLAALIQDVLGASLDAARLWAQASEEIQSSIGLGTGKMDVALSDTGKHLQFFMGTPEYAICPHARCPMSAMSFEIVERDMG